MPDQLTLFFDAWKKNAGDDPTLYQAFQGGLTAGAVSMRARALELAQTKTGNDLINAIGQLPDVPTE